MRSASALLTLLLLACGEGAPGSETTRFDTLPSGVVVATSEARGAWDAGTEAPWVPTLMGTIGAAQGEDPAYLFGSIRAVVVDALNRIYVLEDQSKEIRVFELDGTPVRTMGREGQGPGELLRPTAMTLTPEGHIWVTDPGNGRFQLFDTTGADLGTVPRGAGGLVGAGTGGFDGRGFFREPSQTADGLHLLRIDPATGSALDSIPLTPGETNRFILQQTEAGRLVGVMILSIPFAPYQQWEMRGDTLWSADGAGFELVGLDLSAGLDTALVVRRDVPPIPVDAGELEEYWDFRNLTPAQVRDLDHTLIPEVKRAFESFFADRDGYLWTSRWSPGIFTPRQPAIREFDVFNPGGRFLGTLTLPLQASPAPWIHGNLLVGVQADELDVPRVVIYRLQGRSEKETDT